MKIGAMDWIGGLWSDTGIDNVVRACSDVDLVDDLVTGALLVVVVVVVVVVIGAGDSVVVVVVVVVTSNSQFSPTYVTVHWHTYWFWLKASHNPPFRQGLVRHGFKFTSQFVPSNKNGHWQSYPLTRSCQMPPFRHGDEALQWTNQSNR